MDVYQLDQGNWGVCGFVAAIQAAVVNKKSGVSLKESHKDTLYPVIENFCSSNKDIEKELLNFSDVFGKAFHYESINDVLNKMKGDALMTQEGIGIAMTAKGMSRLCKSLGLTNSDFHGTTATTNTLNVEKFPYVNTIYGLGKKGGGNFRYGLLHWIYVDSTGQIMTWGKKQKEAKENIKANGYDKITHYLPALT
ncbi:hypothetical protein F7734_50715 [Scytonema sp. UIC 10036]|uniref:hypothetical protein n=1 Tax=Scytonema sp. UIC 10036 TaxID=2304196 RepID=UPI0012DAF242|nr:hypothetical protein [Scytonema sp. UIC 10036]MUH00113.1 hypothetical protein [Scytonema sp. UIC 10036]